MSELLQTFLQSCQGEMYPPVRGAKIFCLGGAGLADIPMFYKNTSEAPLLIAGKGDEHICYYSGTILKDLSEEVFGEYWNEPSTLVRRNETFSEMARTIDAIYEAVTPEAAANESIETLLPPLDTIITESRRFNALAWFSLEFDKPLCLALLEKHGIPISPERFDELLEKGAEPVVGSFETKRREFVLSLLEQRVSWEAVAGKCQFFFANYDAVLPFEEAERELRKEYGSMQPSDISALLRTVREEKDRRLRDYESWLADLEETERKLVHYMQEIIEWRDKRKQYIPKAMTIHFRIMERMFREAGIERDLAYFYTFEETMRGIEYLTQMRDDLKRRRNEGFAALLYENARLDSEYGTFEELTQNLQALYLKQHEKEIREHVIRGAVAQPGMHRGIARIVPEDPRSVAIFDQGDVLVTGMTRPEFVSLMKKAGAVVTDEGGITCHAAIISRELRIPCITGTKTATYMLKDGDMIEVDADNGIVKKIVA